MHHRVVLVFLFFSLIVGPASAQVASHGEDSVIDGSRHPELIPDSTAYRLYCLTVANMSPQLQQAELRSFGLSDASIQATTRILAKFKLAYDVLSTAYNRSVTASEQNRTAPDVESFVRKRDALTLKTRNSLRNSLGLEEAKILDSHIQREKIRMKTNDASTSQ